MSKGLQTLGFSFDDPHLTHFGGMVLMQRFCKCLNLRRRLQRSVRLPHAHGEYQSTDVIMALLFAIIAGLRRLNKTEVLQYNGTFLSLLGLTQFPEQSTLRRFLKRLPPATIRHIVRVHDQLRRDLFALPHPSSSLIFDIDSVVLTLYGRQQGARVGYNPKKHGRRSYHPLLCFEASRQEFWHGSLRPGNAASNSGVAAFLRRCLAKVPSTIARSRIRVRADAGYFSGKFIRFLEKQGFGYVIVAREYRGIKATRPRRTFSQTAFRLGGRRVPLYTDALGKTASVCSRAAAIARRSGGGEAIDVVHLQTVRLLGVGYQPGYGALAGVALLQPACYHRKEYPRTAVRFADGQDSYHRLGGQRRFLPLGASGVRSRALVQAAVPATGVFERDAGNTAHRFVGYTGAADAPSGTKRVASAAGLPSPRFVRSCVSTCQPLADTRKNVNLQIASDQYLCVFKEFRANQRQLTLF